MSCCCCVLCRETSKFIACFGGINLYIKPGYEHKSNKYLKKINLNELLL